MVKIALVAKTVTTLERYKELVDGDEIQEPIERLRFFCSLAMKGQDWLDVESFFDDVIADIENAKNNG